MNRPLRVADVTLFYGERSGGIRTYLEAKTEFARRTGSFEHHLVVPGTRSVTVAQSNGYRVPLGRGGLAITLRTLEPDVVLLHDPYWTPRHASRAAHEIGAAVIAVHHSSAALHAAGLPGPHGFYERALRHWYRRAYLEVDAIMSVVDPSTDIDRPSTLRLRLGLDPAFRPPQPLPDREDHVLYVGRLSREKGLRELLEAAAASPVPWPLVLIGTGPAGDTLHERARQLGLESRLTFAPYIKEREVLALAYASASCVVLPGAHETFGLAALEAGACGAAVVTASQTPSASLLEGCVETFRAGDPIDLMRAIERARASEPDPSVAAALVARHAWDQALSEELTDVARLVGR